MIAKFRRIYLSSIAVDFAKKGVNAPRLTKELRPSKYPHYMEKSRQNNVRIRFYSWSPL